MSWDGYYMGMVELILSDHITWTSEFPAPRDQHIVRGVAKKLFMEIKDLLIMKKLSSAQRPNHIDGQELQKHFAPNFHGYPYYWLRRPFIYQALDLLVSHDLIERSHKGFVNGHGSDELFGLGSLGLEIIQQGQSSEAIQLLVHQKLFDPNDPRI